MLEFDKIDYGTLRLIRYLDITTLSNSENFEKLEMIDL